MRIQPLLLASLLAGISTLSAAAWAGARQRVGGLRARTVQESRALLDAPRFRPLHRGPAESGSFGEAAGRAVPAVEAETRPWIEDRPRYDLARDVALGLRPLADLPPEVEGSLVRARPALRVLLAGTRAPLGELPLEWFVAGAGAPRPLVELQVAALLVALDARRALAERRGADALAMCLDGLALGRDAAAGERGVIGSAVAAVIVARLTPVCADALRVATPEERRPAMDAVRAVRDSLPSFPEALRVDLLCSEMLAFTALLEDVREDLGPRGCACLGPAASSAGWERIFLRDAWHGVRAVDDAWIAAAGLSGAERERAFEDVRRSAGRSMNPILWHGTADWGRYATRDEATRLRLDALVAAAAAMELHARTGRWVSMPRDLAAGGLVDAEADRLRGLELRAEGDGLALRLALPRSRDADAASLELTVAAP